MEVNKKLVQRRKFVAGAGAGLLGIIGGTYFLNRDSEDNTLLKQFPDEIPWSREVKKYKVSGAKQCLVHILQMHRTENMNEKTKEAVRKVQEDIYSILSYCIDHLYLSQVYSEAVVHGTDDIMMQLAEIGKTMEAANDILKKFGKAKSIEDEIQSLESEMNDEMGLGLRYSRPEAVENYKSILKNKFLQ